MLKSLIIRTLHRLGWQLRRTSLTDRRTFEGSLMQARAAGIKPDVIIDIGAAYGGAAEVLARVYPGARLVCVEPLADLYGGALERTVNAVPGGRIVKAALGREDTAITFHVHADLFGSSLYQESEGAVTDGVPREVPQMCLDTLARQESLTGRFLLKIDVQGAELDVLSAGTEVLAQTDYIVLEVSLFEFFLGGPLLEDIVVWLGAHGFVCYDILETQYRLLDNALSQVDLVFVPKTGPLRADHRYATPEQRMRQNQEHQASLKRVTR